MRIGMISFGPRPAPRTAQNAAPIASLKNLNENTPRPFHA